MTVGPYGKGEDKEVLGVSIEDEDPVLRSVEKVFRKDLGVG